jgi:hypothetical protein
MHGKIDRNHKKKQLKPWKKSIEPMANSMKTMEKSMNSANGKFSFQIFSKVQVFAPKCSK